MTSSLQGSSNSGGCLFHVASVQPYFAKPTFDPVHIRDVQMTSSRVRLGQSFKTVGYGSASCWGDVGAGNVEAGIVYMPFIVSVQYIGY